MKDFIPHCCDQLVLIYILLRVVISLSLLTACAHSTAQSWLQ